MIRIALSCATVELLINRAVRAAGVGEGNGTSPVEEAQAADGYGEGLWVEANAGDGVGNGEFYFLLKAMGNGNKTGDRGR